MAMRIQSENLERSGHCISLLKCILLLQLNVILKLGKTNCNGNKNMKDFKIF